MPILEQLDPNNEEKTILAKNLCWLSIDETDINKRIEYNENALKCYAYIPSYIWLGKWYSLRGYTKFLRENDGYQEDKTNAENCFQKCSTKKQEIRRNTINHHLFHEWGSHFYRWENYSEGIKKFKEEIAEISRYRNYQSNQNNVKNIFSAKINIINCSCKSGEKPGDLYLQLQTLLNENPYHPYVYVTLGVLKYKEEKYDEALQCFNKSIEIKPDNYSPYWHKARLFLNQNNVTDAESCFNRALELINNTPNEINKIKIKKWGQENLKKNECGL